MEPYIGYWWILVPTISGRKVLICANSTKYSPNNVKTAIVALMLTLIILLMTCSLWVADGLGTSSNQNLSVGSENQSELIPKYEVAAGFLDYENLDIGMRMKYPSDWNKTEDAGVSFYPISRNTTEELSNEFNIFSYMPSDNQSLDQVADQRIQDHRDINPNFRLVNSKPFNFTDDSVPAYMLNYSVTEDIDGSIINTTEVITKINDKAYSISYSAEEEDFSKYLPSVSAMIDSFEVFELLGYENFDIGVRVKYPSDWDKIEESYDSVLFSPIAQNDSVQISNELRISSYSSDKSLDEEINLIIEKYKDEIFGYPEFKLLDSTDRTDSSQPVQILNYSYSEYEYGNSINVTEFITKINDKMYTIKYSAHENDFLMYLPTLNSMFKSIELFDLTKYENLNVGIGLEYPDDWQNYEDFERGFTLYPKGQASLSISSDKSDKPLSEEVNIAISDYKTNVDEYPQFNITGSGYTTRWNYGTSYILNYSYIDPDGITMNATELLVLQNEKLYRLKFISPEEEYLRHFPSINKILESADIYDTLRYQKVFGENFAAGLTLDLPHEFTIEDSSSGNVSFIHEYGDVIGSLHVYPYDGPLANLSKLVMNNPNFEFGAVANTSILTTLGNQTEGSQVEFLAPESGLRGLLSYLKFDGNAYILNFTGGSMDNDYFERFLPTIQAIINSTEIMEFHPVPIGNEFPYFLSEDGMKIKQPKWNVTDDGSYVQFTSNDGFALFEIVKMPSTNREFLRMIQDDTAWIVTNTESILETNASNIITTERGKEFELWYQTQRDGFLRHYQYNNDGNFYILTYTAGMDYYHYYLPIIKRMIESFGVEKNDKDTIVQSGVNVGKSPSGVAINTGTSVVYVANQLENSVSAINASNGNTIANIEVGISPSGIAVDPILNTIYVANTESNSLSVIDGSKNKRIKDIYFSEESAPFYVVVNPITHMIYVGDIDSYDVYVVDGTSNRNISTIHTGGVEKGKGIGMAINEFTNRIYVANPATNNITIIDGRSNNKTGEIPVDMDDRYYDLPPEPYEITINPFTNIAYIVKGVSGTISALDLSKNTEVGNSKLMNTTLQTLAINPFNNRLYAVDLTRDLLHVMNLSSFTSSNLKDKDIKIKVDSTPFGVAVDPNTNLVYVSNADSNTISIINETQDKMMFRIKYEINDGPTNFELFGIRIPVNASNTIPMYCNEKRISDNEIIMHTSGSRVTCLAQSGDSFSSYLVSSTWSGLASGSPIEIPVTSHGTISATFVDLGSLMTTISPALSIIVLGGVVVIASIPSILSSVRKQRGLLLVDNRRPENLSKTEIITINASIIVGVLIFLTISEGFETSEQTQITWITASIIFPFAISVMLAVINHDRFATNLMLAGFVNLLISTVLIVIMKLPQGRT